jgi:AcrR family transcriptional regulator
MAATAKRRKSASIIRRKPALRRPPRRPATQLDLRRTPMQARGQATFESVLDATAALLDQVGGERLTTNLIAQAAGINVATLYQYFPNKQAVLLTLFKRQSEARIQLGESHIADSSGSLDWRRIIGKMVEKVARGRTTTPGTVPLRQLMRSSPELLEHERQASNQVAEALASELQRTGIKRDRAMLVARCAIEALTSLLDMWSIETQGRDNRIVEEAKAVMLGYLAPYFDKSRARAVAKKSSR